MFKNAWEAAKGATIEIAQHFVQKSTVGEPIHYRAFYNTSTYVRHSNLKKNWKELQRLITWEAIVIQESVKAVYL